MPNKTFEIKSPNLEFCTFREKFNFHENLQSVKMFALDILKIRKKKMNKHKWKKRSRIARRSNKGKSIQRKKQE